MRKQLLDKINMVKKDIKIRMYDEATVKQTIILNFLNILDWNIFDSSEVVPEYTVGSRRVDYSLRLKKKDYIFIEVKRPSEDLDKHEEQLLDYAFRQGIEFAILTNSITWWFYLPLKTGSWSNRKFFSIDLEEQEDEIIISKFIDLLLKDNVENGFSMKEAELIFHNRQKIENIKQTLPEAWHRIISEPDSLLVEMLCETTEKICGFRPSDKISTKYILDNILNSQTNSTEAFQTKKHRPKKYKNIASSNEVLRLEVEINNQKFFGNSIPDLYLKVLTCLIDNNMLDNFNLPWGFGPKRFFVFRGSKPIHPSGRDFFVPVTYKSFHLEAHVSRKTGLENIKKLCNALNIRCK